MVVSKGIGVMIFGDVVWDCGMWYIVGRMFLYLTIYCYLKA